MSLKESDLVDGNVYDVLDRGGDRFPSAEWCAAFRVFILRWTLADGEEVEKRLPIESVGYISEFKDIPW